MEGKKVESGKKKEVLVERQEGEKGKIWIKRRWVGGGVKKREGKKKKGKTWNLPQNGERDLFLKKKGRKPLRYLLPKGPKAAQEKKKKSWSYKAQLREGDGKRS